MITLDEYKRWFRSSVPGDILVYHTGYHLYTIHGEKKGAAEAILAHAMEGEVLPSQKRCPDGQFQYRAMRLTEHLKRRLRSWKQD